MALEKCSAAVTANIAMSCDNPIIPGFEEVAILINKQDIMEMVPNATNPRMKTAIELKPTAKTIAVYNPFTTPFEETQNAAVFEGLIPSYTKTANIGVPQIGAEVSMNILEPLMKNRTGFILIYERKNKVGDGSFLIIGSETGAICSAKTANYSDTGNNGMNLFTLEETNCQFDEVVLFDQDYTISKKEFNRLLELSY